MQQIYALNQILEVLENVEVSDIVDSSEDGFVAYSQGNVIVPPVGELLFKEPPGDVHIKYGCIVGDDYYVIKIASGFYDNPKHDLPSFSGMMLMFSQKTGQLESILLDEGHLTNIRTAAAGAVVARYMAPTNVSRIGIFGTGCQGRLQLEYLKPIIDCDEVIAWDISRENLTVYEEALTAQGYNIETTMDAAEVAESCNLIVTATPSQTPLLQADQIRKGTHITAMGSDTPAKQELNSEIIRKADRVVADSVDQSLTRGEVFQARKAGAINNEQIFELGNVIADKALQRTSDEQITVADLTGVAVQDIQICKIVSNALN